MDQDALKALEERFSQRLEELEAQLGKLKKAGPQNKLAMVVFSGDLDKAIAAMIIASGSAAMGLDVSLFFTFWGTPLLRAPNKKPGTKDFLGKMFGAMLPQGAAKPKLSKMHMAGMGTAMIKSVMKKKNVATLPELIDLAGELGVQITICEMSMDLMGFTREEMIDYPDLKYGGVAAFVAEAAKSKIQLFL